MDIVSVFITQWWPAILVGLSVIVEVVPIKVNPWSRLFHWVGNVMLGEFKSEMLTFKREQEEKNANDMRWAIINFANSCRRGELHSKDAWRHVLNQISEYEEFTEKKGIINGVVDAESEYLHQLYKERCTKNDFIK